MVRFTRSGGEANAVAIRIARAASGRDKVAVCGYHGWQDWYIGTTTRNGGVPENISNLSIKINGFALEELERSFDENHGKIACLILEPMINTEPNISFLQRAKELNVYCKKTSVSISALALHFVYENPLIYKMVLGASNFSELKQSLDWLDDKALISTYQIPDFTI